MTSNCFLQYIAGYNVANFWRYPIRSSITKASALEILFTVYLLGHLLITFTNSLDPESEVIKLFSCSTQLSIKFIMVINVKMPTIVCILTFISMINTAIKSLKARKVFIFQHSSFNEQSKFHAQLSWVWKRFLKKSISERTKARRRDKN